jgi:hypothetical protein
MLKRGSPNPGSWNDHRAKICDPYGIEGGRVINFDESSYVECNWKTRHHLRPVEEAAIPDPSGISDISPAVEDPGIGYVPVPSTLEGCQICEV